MDEPYIIPFHGLSWDSVIQAKQKCDHCGKVVEIDAGSFRCAETDPSTGKCVRYIFVCDDCLELEAGSKVNEPECPDGYYWNGRQCLREAPWPSMTLYEREGF